MPLQRATAATPCTMRSVLALALLTAASFANAASPCPAPGEPIHWRADYCMLKMETDDEIAVSECIEQEGKRVFPNACASNTHFKKRMCELMIRSGTRAGTVEGCMKDWNFKGRTVRNGGVGG
jgi:hypothetical protein